MPILNPLTQQIIGCCCSIANTLGLRAPQGKVPFAQHQPTQVFYAGEKVGKAKIEVRRLSMSPGKGAGDLESEVKNVP